MASRVATQPEPVNPDAPPVAATAPSWVKRAGAVGVAGLFLWKFKFLLGAVLSKGKLLLTGFASMGSVLSMVLSLGVYWTAWGWTFALGLVLLIYVHEIGHVAALRSLGVPATAPMFIPGVGAFVSHKPLGSPRDDARVALAGPLWGLVGSAVVYGAYQMTGAPVLAGMAQWGARLNLFNLMPVPPLDGGTAFRSLTRGHRWLVVAALGAALYASGDGMLRLVLLVAVLRALFGEGAAEHDTGALAEILFLVAALTALCMIAVPVPTE